MGDLPLTVPGEWQARESARDDAERLTQGWLADFEDERLHELVREAMENNWDLRQAAARLGVVQGERGVVRSNYLPSITGNGDATRQRTVTTGGGIGAIAGGPISATNTRYTVALGVRWELDVWGRLRDLDAAAIADVQAAEADLGAARQSLAAQVARTWYDLVEAEQQAELARQSWQSFADNAALIEDRFQRGIGSALDLRLTRTNAEGARATYEMRRQQADTLKRVLAVLLGRYPGDGLAADSSFPPLAQEVPAGLPAELLERRPDLLAAERGLAAAGVRISAAEKALLPSISLTASGGTSSDDLSDLLDNNFRIWSLAGNLTAPIWQGGALRARIEQAEAQEQLALANYAQVALDAFREVETALAAETFLRGQQTALRASVEEAAAAEELAWDRYQQGLETVITALQAQRTAFAEKSRLASVRNQLVQNRVDLYLALGGPFFEELEAVSAEQEAGSKSY